MSNYRPVGRVLLLDSGSHLTFLSGENGRWYLCGTSEEVEPALRTLRDMVMRAGRPKAIPADNGEYYFITAVRLAPAPWATDPALEVEMLRVSPVPRLSIPGSVKEPA
ncbi:hypothetical protein [Sorangium sp. So ce388]|uniref:hypothetical protein n=1 Tax=Sorangium sp. So ce388 TaxID=3133309 RepID=UPI003F5C24BC